MKVKCSPIIPGLLLAALLTGCESNVTTTQLETYRGSECPTWFIPSSNNTECECGYDFNFIKCTQSSKQVWLYVILCMTYDNATKNTLVSQCPFSDLRMPNSQSSYVLLPNETSELNDFMCGKMNRVGKICHRCKPGFGPAVLSYEGKCLKCIYQYLWLAIVPPSCMPSNNFIVLCYNNFFTSNFFLFHERIFILYSMLLLRNSNVPTEICWCHWNILSIYPCFCDTWWFLEFRFLSFSHSSILYK